MRQGQNGRTCRHAGNGARRASDVHVRVAQRLGGIAAMLVEAGGADEECCRVLVAAVGLRGRLASRLNDVFVFCWWRDEFEVFLAQSSNLAQNTDSSKDSACE